MTLQELIAVYFPEQERERALCIAQAEAVTAGVRDEGMVDWGQGLKPAKSYGPFALVDVCWDPAMNPASPFSPEQWANILDPNVNVWAASVVWSHGGWRSWTTCGACGACEVAGGPIPYPRGPIRVRSDVIIPGPPKLPLIIAGVGLVALAVADSR